MGAERQTEVVSRNLSRTPAMRGRLFFTQLSFSSFSNSCFTALQATRWARSSSLYCSSAELKASL
jgi:hypothetical protein